MLGASQGAASRAEGVGQEPKDGSSPGAIPQEQKDEDPAPEKKAELLERGRRGRRQGGDTHAVTLGTGGTTGTLGSGGTAGTGEAGSASDAGGTLGEAEEAVRVLQGGPRARR